jgi:hypothetical protein
VLHKQRKYLSVTFRGGYYVTRAFCQNSKDADKWSRERNSLVSLSDKKKQKQSASVLLVLHIWVRLTVASSRVSRSCCSLVGGNNTFYAVLGSAERSTLTYIDAQMSFDLVFLTELSENMVTFSSSLAVVAPILS